jgi:hypothetical protein
MKKLMIVLIVIIALALIFGGWGYIQGHFLKEKRIVNGFDCTNQPVDSECGFVIPNTK